MTTPPVENADVDHPHPPPLEIMEQTYAGLPTVQTTKVRLSYGKDVEQQQISFPCFQPV